MTYTGVEDGCDNCFSELEGSIVYFRNHQFCSDTCADEYGERQNHNVKHYERHEELLDELRNEEMPEGERKFRSAMLFVLALAVAVVVSVGALAHHDYAHRVLFIGEKSEVSVKLHVCKTLEAANNLITVHLNKGYLAASKFFLDAPLCGSATGQITPLQVEQRVQLYFPQGIKNVTMFKGLVGDIPEPVYLFTISVPIVERES